MTQIDGRTAICGLIGNPVEHTLSPVIHNTLSGLLENNLVYVPFPVERERLRAAVEGAFALQVLGLNVTVPYKSEVLPFLCGVEELAEKIGAVNTLVRTESGYRGYNTDMMGLYRTFCEEHIPLKGEEALVLGAGGAARAVAFMCVFYGASRVWILNRTMDRARILAKEINEALGRECVRALPLAEYRSLPDRKYLAIQATSVGLYPDADKAVIEDRAFYEKLHTGFDLIYRPEKTRFMTLAQESGAKAFNGLKMLLYQGITAYELWTGQPVVEKDAQAVYEILRQA